MMALAYDRSLICIKLSLRVTLTTFDMLAVVLQLQSTHANEASISNCVSTAVCS
jgi:hypothetical protein